MYTNSGENKCDFIAVLSIQLFIFADIRLNVMLGGLYRTGGP
jgi:hypothetical protein